MHTDTTPKEKPTGGSNPTAGYTDTRTVPNTADIGKQFATLQAKFALKGHTLHQSGNGDSPGPASYLAERWGLTRYLPTLDDARRFLAQIGGRP